MRGPGAGREERVTGLARFNYLLHISERKFETAEASLLGVGRKHGVQLSRKKNVVHERGLWAERMNTISIKRVKESIVMAFRWREVSLE